MDPLISAAARALSAGDPLAALKSVALRDDPPALALRGIAMAQLGDLRRARELLRSAARTFGPKEPVARARCAVAEAEIALVSRDLGRSLQTLKKARAVLEASGDQKNAAHAGYLEARYLLLIGRLDEAEEVLDEFDPGVLPPASLIGANWWWRASPSAASGQSRRELLCNGQDEEPRTRAFQRLRERSTRQCERFEPRRRVSSLGRSSGCCTWKRSRGYRPRVR